MFWLQLEQQPKELAPPTAADALFYANQGQSPYFNQAGTSGYGPPGGAWAPQPGQQLPPPSAAYYAPWNQQQQQQESGQPENTIRYDYYGNPIDPSMYDQAQYAQQSQQYEPQYGGLQQPQQQQFNGGGQYSEQTGMSYADGGAGYGETQLPTQPQGDYAAAGFGQQYSSYSQQPYSGGLQGEGVPAPSMDFPSGDAGSSGSSLTARGMPTPAGPAPARVDAGVLLGGPRAPVPLSGARPLAPPQRVDLYAERVDDWE